MSEPVEEKKKRMVILTPKQSYDLCNELRAALDEGRQWSTWRAVAEDLGARIGRPEISDHHIYQACRALGIDRCEVHGRNKQQALNFDAQLAQRIELIEKRLDRLDRLESMMKFEGPIGYPPPQSFISGLFVPKDRNQ